MKSDLLLVLFFAMPPSASSAVVHFLTCRHTFEPALIAETLRAGYEDCSSPCAGAVRVQTDGSEQQLIVPDFSYALQALPCASEVRAASIKGLATAALEKLPLETLEGLPKGSLQTHVLVPDLLRGVPTTKAKLLRRCENIADLLVGELRKRYPAARAPKREAERSPPTTASDWEDAAGGEGEAEPGAPCVLLQCLLLEPELLVVSLTLSEAHSSGLGHWPARMSAGLSPTDLEGDMPSSAYRKLLEAFAYSCHRPPRGATCVDLGACPGGWTAALRRRGCVVTAVDRSELATYLMADPAVNFVQGDAFTFTPEQGSVDYAVSDVIAFPERCLELLERWCGHGWAERLVFTMKFKGAEPDFAAIDAALALATRLGFEARCKHFFANKNEVTLMVRKGE